MGWKMEIDGFSYYVLNLQFITYFSACFPVAEVQ
jgi:hypothetical protein